MKSNKLRSILSIVLVLYALILLLPAYTASASSIGTCTCNETITLDSSTYPQSKHNYANNTNDTQVFSYPNATSLTVTFSASTETESDYDFIYLYDGSGVQIGKYSGTAAANKTITIEGDSFSVKLTSDNRTQKYGYSFSSIVAEISYPRIEIAAVAATCTQPGQTAGSKCSKCGSYVQVPTPTDALGHLWSPVTYTWSEDHSTCTASRTCIRSVLTSFENSQFNGSVDDLLDNPTLLGEAFQEFCDLHTVDTTDHEALKNALVLYLAQQAAPASDDACTEAEEAFATVSSTEDFAPTCTEDGSRTFTAAFEVDWAETQTKTVTIPAKGHANVTYDYAGGQIGFTNAGIAALKQSTFVQKLGAEETLRKVAFCCNEAERMSQGIFQNIFAHEEFRQFLASILGVDPSLPAEDLMRNIQDILNDPEVTEDQINANTAFLYVANRVSSMSQEEITQFLCQTNKYNTIRAHSDDNDLCCDALVEGSLVYGMYVAYAHHKNDDSLIDHTGSIITPIEHSDCSAYIEFIKNEQGEKDLNAFLAALEIANSSVRNAMESDNNEAVKHLLINGLANGELVGVVQDALNSYSHTCADCGTALTNHVEITIPGTAPTCTTPGLTEGSKCLLCDQVLVAQEATPSTGHAPGTKVHENVVEATCTAAGSYDLVVYCSTCTTELSRESHTIAATGKHNYVDGKCVCGAELFDIDGANMTLGATLEMNFYILPSDLDASETHYAVITKEYADGRDDVVVRVEQGAWSWSDYYNEYFVTFNRIAAKEMADKISVVIYNSKDVAVSNVWVDSVEDYAVRMLNKEEKKSQPDPEKLTMYVDMLNYGAAAQTHFKYDHVENLANKQISSEQQKYATQTVEMADNREKGDGYSATNLTLESNITMNVFFLGSHVDQSMYAIAEWVDHYGNKKSIRVEGTDFGQWENDTDWFVPVSGMVVADFRSLVTVTIYNSSNEVVAYGVDSLESYIQRNSARSILYPAIIKFCSASYEMFH